jgi:hypothetical protein
MKITSSWDVTPYILVIIFQPFGRTVSLNFQGKIVRQQQVSPTHCFVFYIGYITTLSESRLYSVDERIM